jgi:hypothetical protein
MLRVSQAQAVLVDDHGLQFDPRLPGLFGYALIELFAQLALALGGKSMPSASLPSLMQFEPCVPCHFL